MTETNLHRDLLAALCAVVLATATAVAPTSAQQSQSEGSPAASQFDESTLQAFARASLLVEAIQGDWAPRIEAAGTNQERQQLQAQAQQQMVAAVEQAGLDVATYSQIFEVAQADPELASTINRYRQGHQQ